MSSLPEQSAYRQLAQATPAASTLSAQTATRAVVQRPRFAGRGPAWPLAQPTGVADPHRHRGAREGLGRADLHRVDLRRSPRDAESA